jgi:hypothetical protein
MVWPMELTLSSPLRRQGEKRIESLLELCLDFEEKGFRGEPSPWSLGPPSMSSTVQAQARRERPVNSVPSFGCDRNKRASRAAGPQATKDRRRGKGKLGPT